jgi:rRNA maturation RNase YbeY
VDHYQPKINFDQDVLPNVQLVKFTLVEILKCYKTALKRLDYHFVPREIIRSVNKEHLKHDYETDIITFGYPSGRGLSGEVFICPDVVDENADFLGVSRESEMIRVVFHGALHLAGFDDATDQEKMVMRAKEDFWLEYIKNLQNDV